MFRLLSDGELQRVVGGFSEIYNAKKLTFKVLYHMLKDYPQLKLPTLKYKRFVNACISIRRRNLALLRFRSYGHKSSAVAEMGDRLATIGMGRKWDAAGGCGSPLGPHLTQCGLGRGLPLYQVAS